jgi:hemerythrin-like domain-containing protein
MADLNQEQIDEFNRLAEPASKEADILGCNEARKEAEKEAEKEKVKLPKLSAAEFRTYNSMAEHMEYFHNHFRQSWTMLYTACETNRRPANLSLKQFLSTGLQFCSHLSTHHSIEEMHIFPILARKMPEFKAGRNAAELLRQHQEIHKGMDGFEEYLNDVRRGEKELELSVMKTKMDSWGEVLWKHLDQEVKTLGAENMRRYWSLEEMRRMPM